MCYLFLLACVGDFLVACQPLRWSHNLVFAHVIKDGDKLHKSEAGERLNRGVGLESHGFQKFRTSFAFRMRKTNECYWMLGGMLHTTSFPNPASIFFCHFQDLYVKNQYGAYS